MLQLLLSRRLVIHIGRHNSSKVTSRLRLRRRTVKDNRNLLKRMTLRLGKDEPDNNEEESQQTDVDEVELPRDGVQGDGVNELVEEARRELHGQTERQTLCTEVEGEDFDRVRDGERGVGDVVGAEEEEEEGDCCAAGGCDVEFGEDGGEGGDDGEEDEHQDRREHPEGTAAVSFCGEGADGRADGVPGLEAEVDAGLFAGHGDADGFEDGGEVVRDDAWVR